MEKPFYSWPKRTLLKSWASSWARLSKFSIRFWCSKPRRRTPTTNCEDGESWLLLYIAHYVPSKHKDSSSSSEKSSGFAGAALRGHICPSSCIHILRKCLSFLPATVQQQPPFGSAHRAKLTFVNLPFFGCGRRVGEGRLRYLWMEGRVQNQNFWHFVNIVRVSFMYTFFFFFFPQYFQKPFYITESQPKPNPLNLAGSSLGLVSVTFSLCHIRNCSISQV